MPLDNPIEDMFFKSRWWYTTGDNQYCKRCGVQVALVFRYKHWAYHQHRETRRVAAAILFETVNALWGDDEDD